ncbi:MAG: PAS domain S-box protein [Syntrophales bacterium]|jgi:PAS domain S-box-containing protein|nr:PAS domain S-box protein [Syntrophales bacterium]MCK9527776.1 PAS domain S-box protein [Syntrophales bacterium]MDX9922127.1 PAS domain S-box protein [Syntrophales bacterium]
MAEKEKLRKDGRNAGRRNPEQLSMVSFDGILVHSDGKIIDATQSFAKMTGYSPDELAGTDVLSLVAPGLRDLIRDHTNSGYEGPYEVLILHKDGSGHPFEVRSKNITVDGRVIRVASFRDMAERSRADDLYRTISDKIQTGVYIVQDGRLCFVNSLLEEFTGYDRSELLGKKGMFVVHPRDRKNLRDQAVRMLRGERASPYEFRVVTKSGDIRRVMGTVTPILFNKRPAIMGSGMDVTELREAQEKLENLEALESSILDTIPHAVIGMENRKIIFANNAVHDVFGWEPQDLIGQSSKVLYRRYSDFRETGNRFYGDTELSKMHLDEVPCRRSDGQEIICALTASKMAAPDNIRKAVVVFEDVTERKKAEAALVRERDFAESLIETAQALVLVLDTRGRIVRFNPYTEDLLGYTLDEVRGKEWAEIFTDEKDRLFRKDTARAMISETRVEGTNTVITRDGSRRIVNWNSKALRGSHGERVGTLAVGQDVTEAKESERKLSENYRRMRLMSSELARTEERERQQLATELHDRIGQTMAVAKMKLEGLQKETGSSKITVSLENIVAIVDQLIRDTRSLTFDLSPPILYILGLAAALEWLAEQYQEKYGLPVTFKKKGKNSAAPDKDRAFVLFRCTQELLMNVTKHAGARSVQVSMRQYAGKTEIVVEDDGVGIDPSVIKAPKDWTKGFGLFSIRERLSFMGGRFFIGPVPGGGTRARMVIFDNPDDLENSD